jgi:hypothetical protein
MLQKFAALHGLGMIIVRTSVAISVFSPENEEIRLSPLIWANG